MPLHALRLSSRHSTILDIFQPKQQGRVNTVAGTAKGTSKEKMALSACTCKVYASNDAGGKLDLIPSTLALMEIENAQRGAERKLHNFLRDRAADYHYVIIDCPPTVSLFTQAAILASGMYLVPLKPDPLSVIGLPLLERWLEEFTDDNGIELEQVGLVFTLVRGNTPARMRDIMDDFRSTKGDEVFTQKLSESKYVAEAVEHHEPVFLHSPTSTPAKQLVDITTEFLNRTNGG